MIDASTAIVLLDNLMASQDVIYLLVDDEEHQTTLTELDFNRDFDQRVPANEVIILYTGGTLVGTRLKKGNLYSMIIDRMTFEGVS